MKNPTRTPEFSDCYGSFEECYKNKCTCKCHKLRTLKDLIREPTYDGVDLHLDFEELKQEAIKWVEACWKERNEMALGIGNPAGWIAQGKMMALKDFFNLTEEDLK